MKSPCHVHMKTPVNLWAGQANQEWSRGVVIKRYVENGDYDLSWVSMRALKKEYGNG